MVIKYNNIFYPMALQNIPKLGKFWRARDWKMLIYFMAIWNIFMAIWEILWPLGTFCVHLVHFFQSWYNAPRKIWQPWTQAWQFTGKLLIICNLFRENRGRTVQGSTLYFKLCVYVHILIPYEFLVVITNWFWAQFVISSKGPALNSISSWELANFRHSGDCLR
jgi:hypothetical protein